MSRVYFYYVPNFIACLLVMGVMIGCQHAKYSDVQEIGEAVPHHEPSSPTREIITGGELPPKPAICGKDPLKMSPEKIDEYEKVCN